MRISILTDKTSWLRDHLEEFVNYVRSQGHECYVYEKLSDDIEGDIAFFLSYFHIVSAQNLKQHKNNLVVHASDLPAGRGWSPLTWQIVEGKNEIVVTLFEASKDVDSGDIYIKKVVNFCGDELIDELRNEISKITFDMCKIFLDEYPIILKSAQKQVGDASFYRRRSIKDSELSVNKTISEQFNLLRVVDNESYPAWFEIMGCKYRIKIDKINEK